METSGKKRYIVVGDSMNCKAVLWPAGDPFELHSHQVKGKRYSIEYAHNAQDAKTMRLISDLEDILDRR